MSKKVVISFYFLLLFFMLANAGPLDPLDRWEPVERYIKSGNSMKGFKPNGTKTYAKSIPHIGIYCPLRKNYSPPTDPSDNLKKYLALFFDKYINCGIGILSFLLAAYFIHRKRIKKG